MKQILFLTLCLLGSCFFSSCSDEWKRDVPDPDAISRGTLYDVMKERGEYEIFLKGAERIGYNDLLTGKGLATMFIPNDISMQTWLTDNKYSSIDDMDLQDLESLLSQHMVHYSYSEELFNNFPNPAVSRGLSYKHVTYARDTMFERWDPRTQVNQVVFPMPKYLPVFNENMFKSQDVGSEENYKYFYPNSSWDAETKIYAANAKPLESIAVDNGYLFPVDQVINPMRTIYSVFEDSSLQINGKEIKYNTIKMLFDRFPQYNPNDFYETKYIKEDYGDYNGRVLYPFYFTQDGAYSLLNIGSETTDFRKNLQRQVTTYNGFVPSDEAFEAFFYDFFVGKEGDQLPSEYDNYQNMDKLVVFYLLNYHFLKTNGIIFPELISDGYADSWGDKYDMDPYKDVDYKEICGNGSFYGLNKVLIPEIFKGPTSPFFRTPSYKTFMYVLSLSGLLPTMVNKEKETTVLLPNDAGLDPDQIVIAEDPWKLSNCKPQILKGTALANMTSAEAEIYMNYLSFPKVIKDWNLDTTRWIETNLAGNYLKVDINNVYTEDGETFSKGSYTYNTDGANGTHWVGYELAATPVYPHSLSFKIGSNEAWNSLINDQWYAKLLKESSHWSSVTANLVPFANNRGVIFAGLESWCKPGVSNVPKTSSAEDKIKLDEWFGKHMIAETNNENFSVLNFIEGSDEPQTLKTLSDSGFDIVIESIKPIDDTDTELVAFVPGAKFCVRITIPAQGKGETAVASQTVKAYGPFLARDAVCYIIPNKDNRLVWVD